MRAFPVLRNRPTSLATQLRKVTSKKKVAVSKTELIGELEKHDFDILLTLGAGDTDLEIPKIVEFMHKRND